jgi:ubiquinone/menaquinone biosynthesis C-methylase UbiE
MDIISFLTGIRANQSERLDRGEGSPDDVRQNLAEMQRINDWFGGTRALTRHLYPRLAAAPSPLVVLDLGTGGAGQPLQLALWARHHGLNLRVVAVDWAERNLAVAAGQLKTVPEVMLLRADALNLPAAEGQIDYVISSLFLHHLAPHQVCHLLQDSLRLARRGVIMSDLVRGWLPYLAFQGIAPFVARNHLTRSDGALSVRRAYTPPELRTLASQAGLPSARVYTHFPWRMTLVAEK